jgi:hypothetical protein
MRRTWTWTFDLPPDELWPVLADTNRFNEAMGLPTYGPVPYLVLRPR